MASVAVEESDPNAAVRCVPPGPWAVAVSGGADSVALLILLRLERPDVRLHVVHLDHEARHGESAEDAAFVARLSDSLCVPSTIARRSEMEANLTDLPANPSARYRACRIELFRRVVESERLQGVLLAHHADDQAESVLLRLLRGNSYTGLAGLLPVSLVNGVLLRRPLLGVRRATLRTFLSSTRQPWREDSSNGSDDYARNRARKFLSNRPNLIRTLLELSKRCSALKEWSLTCAPLFPNSITAKAMASVPILLAEASAKRWLVDHGVPEEEADRPVVARLLVLSTDAASPGALQFPGDVRVRRRGGMIFVEQE